MDANLQAAIDARKDMKTAGKRILLKLINMPGSAPSGGTVISDRPCPISKGDFISQLSDTALDAIAIFRQTADGVPTRMRFEHTQEFDLTNPHIRNMVVKLCQNGCMSVSEREHLLGMGEKERSMAEEFLGRKATLTDLE